MKWAWHACLVTIPNIYRLLHMVCVAEKPLACKPHCLQLHSTYYKPQPSFIGIWVYSLWLTSVIECLSRHAGARKSCTMFSFFCLAWLVAWKKMFGNAIHGHPWACYAECCCGTSLSDSKVRNRLKGFSNFTFILYSYHALLLSSNTVTML